jgi:integrase
MLRSYHRHAQVGARGRRAKNLASSREIQKVVAKAEDATLADIKGKIVEYAWWLKKQGYAESTIIGRVQILRRLVKLQGNLYDPESVKEVIAKQDRWSNGRKHNVVVAYTTFLQFVGRTWQPPKYMSVRKLPFIPTETEIDQLIAGCSRKVSAFLQLLKETGIRCGEAWKLKWTDIDAVNNTVRITPEKASNPRMFKLSNKLMAMLNSLPKTSDRIFDYSSTRSLRRTFEKQRKRISYKLGNPRIKQITFHTLRHWKATMEYHRTKDILHVMQVLGHKRIQNTLIYTQLVDFQDDEYVCKVAKTLDEARELIEAGFEYVTDMNSCKLFRKRK